MTPPVDSYILTTLAIIAYTDCISNCFFAIVTQDGIRHFVTVQTIVKTDEILKNIFVDKLKQDEKSR